jgi:hypothetical protein
MLRSARFCLFADIYWSIGKATLNNIGECYTLMLSSLQELLFSQMCFHLIRWENGKCNSSLEIQNQQRFLFMLRTKHSC